MPLLFLELITAAVCTAFYLNIGIHIIQYTASKVTNVWFDIVPKERRENNNN